MALLAAVPTFAHAQKFNSIGGATPQQAPRVPPPPALPGASNGSTAAPAVRSPLDMEPTDALFDAINRGDIAAARDAISRGADLHGRNILGMSPIELSVDLGRNDISFMLLSMRAAENTDNRSAQANAEKKQPQQTKQAKAPARPAHAPATKFAAASPQEPAPSQNARLFSGDGGTPIPNAGFLGFDSSRR